MNTFLYIYAYAYIHICTFCLQHTIKYFDHVCRRYANIHNYVRKEKLESNRRLLSEIGGKKQREMKIKQICNKVILEEFAENIFRNEILKFN